MATQKQIENQILKLLEKNEFLSAKQIVQRMPGVDYKDIWDTLQIFERLQFIGKLVTSDDRTLYFLEEEDEEEEWDTPPF